MKDYNTLTDEERDLIDELQYVELCLQQKSKMDSWEGLRKRMEELINQLKEKGILN